MKQDTSEARAIVVYGASSEDIKQEYKDAARETGKLIAEAGCALVCGGGRQGLMKAAIDGALDAGGEAIGVLPQFMIDNNWQHPGLTRMIAEVPIHQKLFLQLLKFQLLPQPAQESFVEELPVQKKIWVQQPDNYLIIFHNHIHYPSLCFQIPFCE